MKASSEDEAPAKKEVAKKEVAKKEESSSSSSDSSDSEDEAPAKKEETKKEAKKDSSGSSSSSDSSSDEDEEAKVPDGVPTKKRKAETVLESAEDKKLDVAEEENTKVYIRGLPWRADEAEVSEFFGACGEIGTIELPLQDDGRSSGTGKSVISLLIVVMTSGNLRVMYYVMRGGVIYDGVTSHQY